MTTTVTTAETGPLTANGVTPLPFTFQAISAGEIEVTRNGVTASPATYTVTLNTDNTGLITPLATWGSDEIYIYSSPDYSQPSQFERHIPTYPDQFNAPLDRQARTLIGLRSYFNRVMAGVQTDTALSVSLGASTGAGSVGFDNSLGYAVGSVGALLKNLLSSAGSTLIGFIHSGTGAVWRTIFSKLADTIHVKDYGAVCNGSTDDTAAVVASVAAGKAQGKPVVFPKTIKFTGPIDLDGVHIIGPGSRCVVTAPVGAYNTFRITGSDTKIEGFRINAAAKTGGYELELACGTSTIERTKVESFVTYNAKGGFIDSGTTGTHVTTDLIDVKLRGHEGPGFNLTRVYGFCFPTRCTVDYVGVSNSNYDAFKVDTSGIAGAAKGGIYFTDCQVNGTAGTFANTSQRGFVIKGASDVKFLRCQADTVAGDAFDFDGVNKLGLVETEAPYVGGHGYTFKDCTNVTGTVIQHNGRNLEPWKQADKDGLRFVSGNADVLLSVLHLRDGTRHGISVEATQAGPILINDAYIRDFDATASMAGVKTVGTSLVHVKVSTTVSNGKNYDLGGATHRVLTHTHDSGGVADAAGPVVA